MPSSQSPSAEIPAATQPPTQVRTRPKPVGKILLTIGLVSLVLSIALSVFTWNAMKNEYKLAVQSSLNKYNWLAMSKADAQKVMNSMGQAVVSQHVGVLSGCILLGIISVPTTISGAILLLINRRSRRKEQQIG